VTVIGVFGATGKTGRLVMERALEAGHQVRALVRDPAKVTITSDRLVVFTGDVLNAESVDQTVSGTDAVLSLFGQVSGASRTLQTDGTRLVVESMQRHGVKRLVTLSGGALQDEHDRPKVADRIITLLLKALAGHVLADAEGHLAIVEASGLDWTVVRAPRILDRPGTGSYRVGWVGVGTSTRISRADLADFILTQIDDRTYVRQMPFVSA
jgi:putative NADH-flavin reductase